MKNRFIHLLCLLALLSCRLHAQELSNYNLYMQNGFLYNPAYSIDKPEINAFLNSHIQWMGFEGAPLINTFGVHGPITETSGIGLLVSNNSSGLINKFTANFSYAFRVRFSMDHYLQMGAGLGIVNDKLGEVNESTDASDALLTNNEFHRTSFSTTAGLAYFYKRFEAQLIFPQLYQRSLFNLYTIGAVAYNYELDANWDLKPSAIVRAPKSSPAQYDMNVMGMWQKKIWAQVGYRTNKSLLFSLGVNIKGFDVGYAFQKNNSTLAHLSNGTNEIQLIYRFGKKRIMRKQEKMLPEPLSEQANVSPAPEVQVEEPVPVEQNKETLKDENEPIEELEVVDVENPETTDPMIGEIEGQADQEKEPEEQEIVEGETVEQELTEEEKIDQKLVLNFELKKEIELIHFEFDGLEILEKSQSNINRLKDFLNDYPTHKVKLIGHTDSYGDEAVNEKVSLGRAYVVGEYLKAQGIASDRLILIGKGEANPVAENTTEEGRRYNRRVEVIVIE